MEKKLAIKGHPTRGKEVIELLEMMGGSNIHNLSGNDIHSYHMIKGIKNEICDELRIFSNENIYYFTLEEFLEKYPFKIGDKVIDEADGCPGVVSEMKWDEDVSDMKYCVVFGNGIDFGWYVNDSIEFCKENENLKENKFPPFEPMFKMNDELEYMVPDGYEITEVSKDKVFIKPIKSKYPKTYEECCEVIGISPHDVEIDLPHPYQQKMFNLFKLRICRDAYWKIAGEEMGLNKPWEPDWTSGKPFHCISVSGNIIGKGKWYTDNKILAFPTEEMRDAFFENFKDLIEQCKELL